MSRQTLSVKAFSGDDLDLAIDLFELNILGEEIEAFLVNREHSNLLGVVLLL
jgi:hypothetical protein